MSLMTITLLFALFFLLLSSAFFSSAETAFFSLNPLNIRRILINKPQIGAGIQTILSVPTKLLSTILIGNTIVNVAASVVGYSLARRFFPGHGEAIAIPAMTLLLLFFGEVGPKRIGIYYAENLAVYYTPLITFISRITKPLRIIIEQITLKFEWLFKPRGRTLSEEEFETVLDISGEEGVLDSDELAMIKAITNLEDIRASDVMTPRVDLIGIDLNDYSEKSIEIARKAKFNFLILFRDQFDNIEGFLDVRKYLLDPEHRIDAARLPPFFVPESSPLNLLLLRFQKERRRMAVVVDEYGGTAGVLTRGDIIEEITGDMYNELNKPSSLFQNAGPHRWLVDANISLEELNRKLRLNLESEGSDRLAGWIAEQLERMPRQDDVIEAQGCRITVLQTVKLRVTMVQLEKTDGIW